MTRYTPNNSNGDFDLADIFIGRQQQIDLFEIYLQRWKQLMLTAASGDSPVTAAPSPNNKIQGLVVLLFGRGGFGKSTLLKRYRDIVLQAGQNLAVSKIVDWEFAVEGKRGLFNPSPGQELDAAACFNLLCGVLALALDKDPKVFRAYHAAVRAVEQARKEASSVLDGMQNDDHYGWLRRLTVEAITLAVRTYIPGSAALLENELVKGVTDEVAKLTQEQIAHVYARLRDRLGSKLGDYLEPSLQLGLGLGKDLRELARNFPLLIFFDTYEEADEVDRLLRMVMGAAGLRVGWVLAGRDNLWAGAEQRERSPDVEYGYKEIVSTDRSVSIDFNAGDIGAFTLNDISEYFALMRESVPLQPPLPAVMAEQAKRILDVTQGVPLAVKIAADLYLETGDLAAVTEHVEGKRAVVDQMVRRYLLHTRANQEERVRLYGLALLRRTDQPTAIAAALELTPEQARTTYSSELSRLHRRYSFIFTEKGQPALHQEVRYFLRLWLLEHRKEPEILAINQRLKEAHEETLRHLEEQMQYMSLKERFQDDEWVGNYLDLTEQQLWLDPVQGVRCLLPLVIAASIYRRAVNKDATNIGKVFEQQIRQPYRDWLEWANHSLVFTTSRDLSLEELASLEALSNLASERCPTFPQWLPDYRKELEAALWWRLGEGHQNRDQKQALAWYERALSRLGRETELREAEAETYYELGKSHYLENNYNEGISSLDRAIELKTDYARAYILRGLVYTRLIEYERAIQDYNRGIELDPKDAQAYNYRGVAYNVLKEYKRAIQDYNRANELDPNYVLPYYNRGTTYSTLKEYERAIQDYDRAIERGLGLNFFPAYNARGEVYSTLKEYERAIQDYNLSIALYPRYAKAYLNRGVAYSELKQYERAIQDFDQFIELGPKDAQAYRNRGITYGIMGGSERAIQDFDQAIELDPKDAQAYNDRGVAYRTLKEYERAIQDFDQAIELDSKDARAYNNRGTAYRNLEEHERAIQDYDRAIELDLKYSTAYYNRGNAYRTLEKYERAIQDYDRAIELDPSDAKAYRNRGLAYLSFNAYERVIQDYDRAIELDPNNARAYYIRGLVYDQLKEYDRAIQDYDRTIELDPNDAQVYDIRGYVYLNLKEYDRAIQDYDRTIELDSNNAQAYLNRGLAYQNLKKYTRTIQDFDRGIELDPNNAQAFNNRGIVYGIVGEYERAIQDFDQTIELNPEYAQAYFNRGYAYQHLKEYERAIQDFNQAIELNPEYAQAYFNRGYAYQHVEEFERAIQNYDQAIELNPEYAQAYTSRGATYAILGKYKQAIQDFDKAIELNPNDAQAYRLRDLVSQNL